MGEADNVRDNSYGLRLTEHLESFYRSGRLQEVIETVSSVDLARLDPGEHSRVLLLQGMALYDLGDAVGAIHCLRSASEGADVDPKLAFEIVFALFLRLSDFSDPQELIPRLADLRQLASHVGDVRSLGSLHLAVARLEGIRGRCADAHRHMELSRRLIEREQSDSLLCALDLVTGSLESIAGNLTRCRVLAETCLGRARAAGFVKHVLGASTNLGVIALYQGQTARSRRLLEEVLAGADSVTYVKLGALDNLAQLELFENRIEACAGILKNCRAVIQGDRLPSRSWYDLAHQVTRCAYHERTEEWQTILDICEEADAELVRRQYRVVRTTLLCAKARALGQLGRHAQAQSTLALAVRTCPRGAVDPLIVLEASHGICLSLRGDLTAGRVHFDRAAAACRAIGHRYHERWIERHRTAIHGHPHTSVAVARPPLPLSDAALLFSDIGTIVGAGHSIDLLAHRTVSLLQSTSLGPRLSVDSVSGCEFQADPTAHCDTGTDGTFDMRLRGSDRKVTIRVRDVRDLEEIALLRGVAELVRAAVHRSADGDQEDDTLWPRTLVSGDDDTVFRSPRMIELVRVAMRLAATDLPVLITGETGTGKEIFARLIHDHSKVKRGPFVAFNCAAVPRELVESQLFGHRKGAFTGATDAFPGVIRAAAHGTVFLDEVADLDLMVQPKLLRCLERNEVHPVGEVRPVTVPVRLVAATNGNVEALVAEGRFRPDLYYRLGVARLALPPLRERKDEIPALAELFLTRYSRECGRSGLKLGDDFVAALLLHDWPGNLRELSNEIRRAVAMAADGDTLSSSDLMPQIAARWNSRPVVVAPSPAPGMHVSLNQTLAEAVDELEQRFIEHALAVTNGRLTEAADLLGLSRKGLFLKRRRRGLTARPAGEITTAADETLPLPEAADA